MEDILFLFTRIKNKRFLIPFVFLCVVSCQPILLKILLKNPVVETQNSILSFVKQNGGNDKNHYMYQLAPNDKAQEKFEIFFKGVQGNILIFNRDSILINNADKEYCEGKVLTDFLENRVVLQEQREKKMKEYLKNIVPISPVQDEKADYFVVLHWSKATGKRGWEDVLFFEEKIKQSNKAIRVLKINTDFNAHWGLKEGRVIRYKIDGEGKMIFDDLPYL